MARPGYWHADRRNRRPLLSARPCPTSPTAAASGTFQLGGDLPVHRLGFGAMRITGKGIWGPPADHDAALQVLRRTPSTSA